MSRSIPDDPGHRVALARFAAIFPLLADHLPPDQRAQRRVDARTRPVDWPDGTTRTLGRRTIERWLAAYRTGGLDALRPQPRADRGRSRRLRETVIARAIALREELPARSTRHLVELLALEGHVVKETTLRRLLAARGATRQALQAQGASRAFPRYEQPRANAIWQSDAMDGPWLPDPLHPDRRRKTHLIGLLDDHSRYIVHAQYYWIEGVLALQDATRQAVVRCGVSDVLYADNGPAYRSIQFETMLARIGTRLIHATPYHPQGKGKCERFWLTVQTDFQIEVERAGINTLDELNTAFAAWLEDYHARPHAATGEAPQVRFARFLPHLRRVSLATLAQVWRWETSRRVDKAGLVKLQGNAYRVADALVGKAVQLRYDPLDLGAVEVWHDGVRVQAAEPYALPHHTAYGVLPTPEAVRLLPLPSARAYHEGQLRRQRDRLAGALGELPADAVPSLTPTLAAQGLLLSLTEALAPRPLADGERAQVLVFAQRHGLLDAAATEAALTRAVALKGTERPLTYYLARITDALEGGQP